MATIVNNPAGGDSSSGMGVVVGMIAIVVLAALFFVFGLPMLRGGTTSPAQQINIPSSGSQGNAPAPQINIPDKVDVNVNKDK